MDGQIHLLNGVLVLSSHREFVDDLGRVPADYVRAQNLAILFVAYDLDKALSFTSGAGSPVGAKRKTTDLVLELALLGLILCHADARHLWMAVGHAWHVIVLDRLWMVACNQFSYYDTFPAALVGQHRWAGHVSNCVNTGGARLECCGIHLDEAPIG